MGDTETLDVDELTCHSDGTAMSQRHRLASWFGLVSKPPSFDASLPAGMVYFYYEDKSSTLTISGRFAASLEVGHHYTFVVDRQFVSVFKGSTFKPVIADLDTGAAVAVRMLPASINDQILCGAATQDTIRTSGS